MRLASSTSVSAPVGGLNDRDSIADMPKNDAVIMENWWPYPSFCQTRKGSSNRVTGFPAAVETLVEYLPTSGVSTLFAASDASIYDATGVGPVGAPVQAGLGNARFQDVNITTPGGSFLYLVNGIDSPRLWDGATWTAVTGISVPAITGVTTSLFVHAALFKNRLFFVERDSMRLWYLPVNSIGGAASQIDFGSIFRLGGSIMAAYTWTVDAGNGSDDHLVTISTMGEIAVFSGTDPSAAATWRLVGVFRFGRPIGRRCATKYGGDLAIITADGVFPLGKGLLSYSVDRRVALTDKIQNSVSLAAASLFDKFGWQICLNQDESMLLLNIPRGGGANYQFAMNTITGAWTKFTGWNASSWVFASTGLYFGDGNSVKKAWVGELDVTTPISADVLTSFSYFGSRARTKYFTMIKPYLEAGGTPSILYGLNTDFSSADPAGSLSFAPPTGMVWGSMVWGSMVWGGTRSRLTGWQTVGAVGNSGALRMKILNNGGYVRFDSCDYVFQVGGIL